MMTHRPQLSDQKNQIQWTHLISIRANVYLEPYKAIFNPTDARPAARVALPPVGDPKHRHQTHS